jgi:uncharacterized protein (DUF2164 family)
MDKDAERKQLQDEKAFIESWKSHALTASIFTTLREEEDVLVNVLCGGRTVHDTESFFTHFEAVGHLRGLRRARALIDERLEEIKEELKDLEDHGN